jgi:glycosyltransferase involved in cell wall biosynthesis
MPRTLVAIPAHNEAVTIEAMIGEVRQTLPTADLVVLDDGSTDDTAERARRLGATAVRHSVNLGYGRAVQTALKLARARDYETLVTLDGDGQHDPACLPALLEAFGREGLDLCIGSRYVGRRGYRGAALGRQLGMRAFSALTGLLTGRRIYDTTSGLKAMRNTVFEPLTRWHFVDFHAEALVYLLRLGYHVGEHPVVMRERTHGDSMYGVLSSFKYPSKTLLMVALGLMQAEIERRHGR